MADFISHVNNIASDNKDLFSVDNRLCALYDPLKGATIELYSLPILIEQDNSDIRVQNIAISIVRQGIEKTGEEINLFNKTVEETRIGINPSKYETVNNKKTLFDFNFGTIFSNLYDADGFNIDMFEITSQRRHIIIGTKFVCTRLDLGNQTSDIVRTLMKNPEFDNVQHLISSTNTSAKLNSGVVLYWSYVFCS